MSVGSVGQALRNHRVLSALLGLLIVVCGVPLAVADVSRPWSITLQVISAIAGALLGNVVRIDLAQHDVQKQARPATRHLFDQVSRIRVLVQQAEGWEQLVRNDHVDRDRIADWFGSIGQALRTELNSAATALESWGDLVPEVLEVELEHYQNRESRLPSERAVHDAGPVA